MVITLIVVPFLFFSLLITNIYSAKLEKVISESLYVVANAQVAEMTKFCEQQKDYLVFIGATDIARAAMRGGLDHDMSQYLDNMLYSQAQTMSYMHSLLIVDKNSHMVACSVENSSADVNGIKGIIQNMGGRPFYISDVLTDAQGCRTLVAIARIEAGKELLGYALSEINLDFYEKIREQARLWNDSTFYLVDGCGQIISAGTQKEKREDFITTAKERESFYEKYNAIDFDKHPQGNFQYTVKGNHYITYYSTLEYTNWKVMLTVNLSNYQAQKTVYSALALFMILLCLTLAVWIGWFASRRIVHPIKHISSTLKAIQQNQDYSLRAGLKRKDELGILAEEINELIDFIETEDLYKIQQQRLLLEKAEQDALTKVLNKERINHFLQEAIGRHCADRTVMAVLFVDIDDFKAFNTQYGHNVGDQVLLFLTSLLSRETDGTVGRVGGDEFLVVIESPEYIASLDLRLRQLQDMAGSRFIVRGSGIHLPVFCCIGAVRIDFTRPGLGDTTAEQVINLADNAMYHVKNNGKRGHIIWDYEQTGITRT